MSRRYHYEKGGNYKGYSTNEPPYASLVGLVGIILVVWLIVRGCS